MVTHDDGVDAVQAHSRATATFKVPVPPAASKDDDEFVIEGWQRVFVGAVTDATFVLAELPQDATMTAMTAAATHCNDVRTQSTPRSDARFSPHLTQPLHARSSNFRDLAGRRIPRGDFDLGGVGRRRRFALVAIIPKTAIIAVIPTRAGPGRVRAA
jgi:hypothetical protein